MGIGQEIISELLNDKGYFQKLDRNSYEIEKIEEQLRGGMMPSIFKLHSKESVVAPQSAEEYMEILSLVDIKQAQVKVIKEIVERVMGYPINYYAVKRKVTEALRERSMEYIRKNKKLEASLFKAHVLVISRCCRAYFDEIIMPLCKEGMTSTVALIISRVIMRCTSEKSHMEELLRKVMQLEKSHSVYTLLTAILIKKIQFGQRVIDEVHEYVLQESAGAEGPRFLAWNKVVLVFVRNYKTKIDQSGLREIYSQAESPIEVEILKELSE
ncbi:essential nuclear protein 1 [Nematocida ausubeli]|nr:essential nuclear protein 1 [Nematocida ausubeli]